MTSGVSSQILVPVLRKLTSFLNWLCGLMIPRFPEPGVLSLSRSEGTLFRMGSTCVMVSDYSLITTIFTMTDLNSAQEHNMPLFLHINLHSVLQTNILETFQRTYEVYFALVIMSWAPTIFSHSYLVWRSNNTAQDNWFDLSVHRLTVTSDVNI